MTDTSTLHDVLDWKYGPDGEAELRQLLANGADVHARKGPHAETPLHVATRRRRLAAALMLLDHGADIDAKTRGGKTAYAHAVRRKFTEMCDAFVERGASIALNEADRLAVAVVNNRLEEARTIIEQYLKVVRSGNPEEDRLLADVTGREGTERVALLVDAGADLRATGLDSGTPLHQAAWFGQPANARILIDAGAPLDIFEPTHESSPLGWAVHGSRYAGGAEEREESYVEIVHMLLEAGAGAHYPDQPNDDNYRLRLLNDASPKVKEVLQRAWR